MNIFSIYSGASVKFITSILAVDDFIGYYSEYPMSLSRLTLTNFRNHIALDLRLNSDFIIFSGENGSGKTNILESVSMLAPGRGLRRVALRDMAMQDGSGGFAISAQCNDIQMGTGTEANAADRRILRINGAAVPINRIAEYLSITWLTPAMDRLFNDGASARRRFLDRLSLALYPDHAHHASRYDNAMRQRNRIFADDGPIDEAWVMSLETIMAEHGFYLSENRRRLVEGLNAYIGSEQDNIFAKPLLEISCGNYCSIDELEHALRAGRSRDRAAKRSLIGPHRDDLLVTHKAKGQAAAQCSTGEQKALLLSLILSHASLVRECDKNKPLLILLDEVAAHLDPARRLILFDKLSQGHSQIWLTGTERDLFKGTEHYARHYHFENGELLMD